MTTEMTLAEKIIACRGKYNITQVELANMCKVSPATIINIENQKIKGGKLTRAKIETVLQKLQNMEG